MNADRNLDILRAMAVLAVLVAHCLPESAPQQAAGHYAVLIFFVHTALVLLLSLKRQVGAPSRALRFYIQRVFRIYPVSILCVLISLAFRIAWPDPVFTPRSGLSITANLFLVQNFLREPLSISAPLWSLPFEVQMYAVLPAIFLFLGRRGMRGAASLAAVSIALAVAEAVTSPFQGLWLTKYVPCFIGGALAYCAYGGRRPLPWGLWPVVVAGLGVFYWISGHTVPSGWLACLALGLSTPLFQQAPRSLLAKAAALVARYSYGIYLSHVPLLWLCFQRLTGLPVGARWALFAALMCVVPVVLYHAIEQPMIQAGRALSFRIFPPQEAEERKREFSSAA